MGQTLTEIAQTLRDTDKKVQLINAFNGVGKTRLSREFKELIALKAADEAGEEADKKVKVLYYNAFTEDLFYWNNDETDRRLVIQPNGFTNWILQDQGQERNIVTYFQRYINDEKLTPNFNVDFSEIRFSIERGNEQRIDNIKISKGEESCLVWCVFFSLLKQINSVLEIAEPAERETDQFNDLKYIFIDDPVSSLDENHLIEIAVNISELIKESNNLKFVISTHNALFYNVLYNELGLNADNNKKKGYCCFMLKRNNDGTYDLKGVQGDSNKSFSYHLYLKQVIEEAIATDSIQKYHFMLLRNLYEKTANFLGYPKWSDLLPDDKTTYYNRIIQFSSHSTLSNEAVPEPSEPEKNTLKFLLNHLVTNKYWQKAANEDGAV